MKLKIETFSLVEHGTLENDFDTDPHHFPGEMYRKQKSDEIILGAFGEPLCLTIGHVRSGSKFSLHVKLRATYSRELPKNIALITSKKSLGLPLMPDHFCPFFLDDPGDYRMRSPSDPSPVQLVRICRHQTHQTCTTNGVFEAANERASEADYLELQFTSNRSIRHRQLTCRARSHLTSTWNTSGSPTKTHGALIQTFKPINTSNVLILKQITRCRRCELWVCEKTATVPSGDRAVCVRSKAFRMCA